MANMKTKFSAIGGNSAGFRLLVVMLGLLSLGGFWSAYMMYLHGHHITGMTNAIPWGFPIVMAVYLIGLSAGSLVLSALSSVFGRTEFKPLARISALLAALLLIGALMCIILDWGRPDRILVPFFSMNPRSMFSLNGMLYSAYIGICFVYLWAMFNNREKLVKLLGYTAVFWAVLVHSGTGAIFGFVGARELYSSPLLPPSFIAAALSSGTALMIMVLYGTFKLTGRALDDELIRRLGLYLAAFIVVVAYLVFIENVTRSYWPGNYAVQKFLLLSGNKYSLIFWIGMIGCGLLFPFVILANPATGKSVKWILFASALVVIGVLAERYIIVIPGQVMPMEMFPGYHIAGPFQDGRVIDYCISPMEILFGAGILSFVFFLYALGLKFFEMMPDKAVIDEGTAGEKK
ncbi:MAG: polysulfide reductase NrfD [Nitrospinae bacterium]|nr:polysulfide reductase NrfD [Nitrospinota bacterium]